MATNRTRLVRILFALLVLGTTAMTTFLFAGLLWRGGWHWVDVPLLALFAVLSLWITISFWMATLGFFDCLRCASPVEPVSPEHAARFPLTALLMPVCNENPARVFAGLRAMWDSLDETQARDRFHIFVLSDTNEPEIWLWEEEQWAAMIKAVGGEGRVFYRRRASNTGRKSGNIEDFCRRWGGRYEYMVVLDADSVLSGPTLVEMVRRMEESPDLGILQVRPRPVNRGSLFARSHQFAASVYGPVCAAGLARWAGTEGLYWGHNAIVRIRPFMEHCGLPRLPGRPPLGGEILSHDFVEAALMRRAGWKVCLAADLGGSYEECPPTVIDFARRDQRWCQGDMQHLKLVFSRGLHAISRIEIAMGAMAYLVSYLWAFFVLSAIAAAAVRRGYLADPPDPYRFSEPVWRHPLLPVAITAALLLLPKLWGYIVLLCERKRLAAHGGAIKALLGVLVETIVSALIAPVFMAFHLVFVASTFLGRSVSWGSQRRGDTRVTFSEAARVHAVHTAVGVLLACAGFLVGGALFWWTLPVSAGLALSIPLCVGLSSPRVGRFMYSWGLLLIPEETRPPPLLRRQRQYFTASVLYERSRPRVDRFRMAVLDPVFLSLHIAVLRATRSATKPTNRLRCLAHVALYGRPEHLTRDDKLALLGNEQALRWLHEQAWRHWSDEFLEEVSHRSVGPN